MFEFLKRKKKKTNKTNKWLEAHEKLDKLFDEKLDDITYQDPQDFNIDAEIQRLREDREKLKQERQRKNSTYTCKNHH